MLREANMRGTVISRIKIELIMAYHDKLPEKTKIVVTTLFSSNAPAGTPSASDHDRHTRGRSPRIAKKSPHLKSNIGLIFMFSNIRVRCPM
jgi:hypothetical protein